MRTSLEQAVVGLLTWTLLTKLGIKISKKVRRAAVMRSSVVVVGDDEVGVRETICARCGVVILRQRNCPEGSAPSFRQLDANNDVTWTRRDAVI